MEEQKKEKTMAMKTNESGNGKLTYEQLNDACNQLWQQNRQLVARTKELEQFAVNKRLDYLFRIVENSKMFSDDFIENCINEIEEAMTIPNGTEDVKEGQ